MSVIKGYIKSGKARVTSREMTDDELKDYTRAFSGKELEAYIKGEIKRNIDEWCDSAKPYIVKYLLRESKGETLTREDINSLFDRAVNSYLCDFDKNGIANIDITKSR